MVKYLEYKTIERFLKNTLLEKLKLTKKQLVELQNLLESEVRLTSHDRRKTIHDFIINKVEDKWVERIIEIRKIGAKSTSLKNYQLRYGDDIGKEKYENHCNDLSRSEETYVLKYGKEKGKFLYQKSCTAKKGIATIKKFIELYGETAGVNKWQEYQKKRKQAYEKKISEGFKFNNGRSLPEYIRRHGVDNGYVLWEERNNKQSYRFSIEYYIEKYGEEDGIKKYLEYIKSMNKTSLKSFIKRYGKEDGLSRYRSYIESRKNNIKTEINSFIDKYGEAVGRIKYKNWLQKLAIGVSNSTKNKHNSKVQKLFWELFELLDNTKKEKVKFKELNGEEKFYIFNEKNNFILVDFICGKAIIEFQGQIFHSSTEAIKNDLKRKKWLNMKGYEVLEIKELDFNNNKLNELNKCINFVNKFFK